MRLWIDPSKPNNEKVNKNKNFQKGCLGGPPRHPKRSAGIAESKITSGPPNFWNYGKLPPTDRLAYSNGPSGNLNLKPVSTSGGLPRIHKRSAWVHKLQFFNKISQNHAWTTFIHFTKSNGCMASLPTSLFLTPYFHPHLTPSTLHHHHTISSSFINTTPIDTYTLYTKEKSAKFSLKISAKILLHLIKKLSRNPFKSRRILRTFKERSSKIQEETFFIQKPPSKPLQPIFNTIF